MHVVSFRSSGKRFVRKTQRYPASSYLLKVYFQEILFLETAGTASRAARIIPGVPFHASSVSFVSRGLLLREISVTGETFSLRTSQPSVCRTTESREIDQNSVH